MRTGGHGRVDGCERTARPQHDSRRAAAIELWQRRRVHFRRGVVATYRGESPRSGGVANEQCRNGAAETPAAVVRAHGLARSSRAVPAQWRSIPVDHVEQAWLGRDAPRHHRAEVRARAQRHHRLPRRRSQPRRDRDERLGRGPSRWWLNLEAHPDAVVQLPRQQARLVHARLSAGEERDRLWQRWVAVDPRLDAYAVRRSTETPVIVLEPRKRSA